MTEPILITPPAVEPVTLAEAKAHLRLEVAGDDALVATLIAAARAALESETRRAMVAQTWRWTVDDWPSAGLTPPVGPVLSVDAVRWLDDAGAATGLAASAWRYDAAAGRVLLLAPEPAAAGYEIDVTAGYGAAGADVPAPLRQAMLMLVAHWYEHRSAAATGAPEVVPAGVVSLAAPYRRMALS